MTQPAIRVQGIGKEYRLGAAKPGALKFREALSEAFARPLRRALGRPEPPAYAMPDRPAGRSANTFWALRNVSFDVQPGEILGIIGRNGAGKSTLLKILSQITEPTEGGVDLYGRVGSLLEVGTGFHPDLSGRENVFLNGAMLGMKRTEITRKFDDIVAFAEIAKFIDMPVKHYSSGMYTRLAFAVAAHLEPEILIVDEVLAVGDAGFQKRCLTKMEDVGKEGRTVIFVSHNMPAVTRLCQRAVLLEQGEVAADGPAHVVASQYLRTGLGTTAAREWPDPQAAPGDDVVRLRAVYVKDEAGRVCDSIDIRKSVVVEVHFDVLRSAPLLPAFHFFNEDGLCVFASGDPSRDTSMKLRPPGRHVSLVRVPGNFLAEGSLLIDCHIATAAPHQDRVSERQVVSFQVIDSMEGDAARGMFGGHFPGMVRPLLAWEHRYLDRAG